MDNTSIFITIVVVILTGVCSGLAFQVRVLYLTNKNLMYLLRANYRLSRDCEDYYAPDNWSSGSLSTAARRAQLEMEIKEFKLKIPVDDLIKGQKANAERKEAIKSVDNWLSKK